ncbi:MAG: hypothetical protein ACREIG_08175 [Nitrospiraceae bacterium]
MRIQQKIWVAVFLASLATSVSAKTHGNISGLDPRLDEFLVFAIKDKSTLNSERRVYATHKVSFEQFILSIYSGGVKLDDTPDNSNVLAQLGGYLEDKHPSLSPELLKQMEEFYAIKSNQTFMRGMFLETIRAIIVPKK